LLSLFENVIEVCDRLASWRRKDEQRLPAHLETGLHRERAAFFYLQRNGFVIAARGWRSGRARRVLDLVAWEGDTICFIEVKTRTTCAIAPAEVAVDENKQKTLQVLARHFLRQLPQEDILVRFDILPIDFESGKQTEFELFRGKFGWS
jgi:putative endonuclease